MTIEHVQKGQTVYQGGKPYDGPHQIFEYEVSQAGPVEVMLIPAGRHRGQRWARTALEYQGFRLTRGAAWSAYLEEQNEAIERAERVVAIQRQMREDIVAAMTAEAEGA